MLGGLIHLRYTIRPKCKRYLTRLFPHLNRILSIDSIGLKLVSLKGGGVIRMSKWERDSRTLFKETKSNLLVVVGCNMMRQLLSTQIWCQILNLVSNSLRKTSINLYMLVGNLIPLDTHLWHQLYSLNTVSTHFLSQEWDLKSNGN